MDVSESFLIIDDENKEDTMSYDEDEDPKESLEEKTDTEESDENLNEEISDDFYLSRNKTIQWYKEPQQEIKQKEKSKCSPGVIGFAQGAKSPIEAWQMYFPDSSIEEIVQYTNLFIADIRKDYSRERDACDTNQAEVKAVIGLLYLAGIMKNSHQNLADLWAKDGTGVEYFHATISLKRFRFLLYCLHFDITNKNEKTADLFAIRTFFEKFTFRCSQHFSAGQNITVGELYEPFRGKCIFKKPLKNKIFKYGIKIYSLIDTKQLYTLNMEVNTMSDYCKEKNFEILEKLIQPTANSNRNLTYNKKFTTIKTAEKLLQNYHIYSIGLCKNNNKEIPKLFIKNNSNNLLFGFYKDLTLISQSTENSKPLVYLSTIYRTNQEINKTKPEEISFHNNARKSVDSLQELCNNYSVSRKTSRWPLTIFFFLLNIAGINSQILLQANLKSKLNRREYLISVAKSLTTDYLKIRAAADNLPQHLRMRKRQLAGIVEQEITKKQQGGHGRCTFCSWKKNRKTTTVCNKCSKYICREHTISTCVDCAAKDNECDSD